MDQVKIGAFLKELRKEKELTQEELGEQFNVSSRTVSRWETGSNMPDLSLLIEIADFYDVDIREIINGERKSEKMNEEVKDVATVVSDYAEKEKAVLLKRMRWISLIGLFALIAGLIMESAIPDTGIPILEMLRGVCFGVSIGALLTTVLFATGKLEMLRAKKRKQMKVMLTVCIAIIILFFIAALIETVLW